MKLDKIRDMIFKNKLVGFGYKTMSYCERGRGVTNKIMGPVPEMMIYIGFIIYVLKINLSNTDMIIWVIDALVLFTIIGYAYTMFGFYKIERKIQTNMDPIMYEIHSAATHYNSNRSYPKIKK